MRAFYALLPLAVMASPALAARADEEVRIPTELTDPAMAATLGKVLGSLTKAMMDMPIGEVQAAVAGREPTGADKARTLRDVAGGDANLDRKVERQVAEAVPRMQAGLKAMSKSLPAIARAVEEAAAGMEDNIDRATANLPQPGYPKR